MVLRKLDKCLQKIGIGYLYHIGKIRKKQIKDLNVSSKPSELLEDNSMTLILIIFFGYNTKDQARCNMQDYVKLKTICFGGSKQSTKL